MTCQFDCFSGQRTTHIVATDSAHLSKRLGAMASAPLCSFIPRTLPSGWRIHLDFSLSESQTHWLKRVREFMRAEVHPAMPSVETELSRMGADRWQPSATIEALKSKAKAHGGGGVSNDFGLAQSYASVRTLRLADGPDEVHNRAIARWEFARYSRPME
jgi:hypothetical protein